jgi:hypothetical protein
MICLNETAPSTRVELPPRLLTPIICAFRAKDKSWMNFLPNCHWWLFSLVKNIAETKDWSVDDIYSGLKPVDVNASMKSNAIELILFVEGFQYSKITFKKEK